jgi:GrpB-like predicted nucleotidyltransferase (UPF0157 family)
VTWSERYPSEQLAPYRVGWTHQYADLAEDLGRALGPAWEIEHVGSTSVPGLAAKPVIDLAVRIPSGIDLYSSVGLFTGARWTAPRELGDHAASFLLVDGVRRAIAHVFAAEQWAEAHVRLFSEWLRSHPFDRDRYDALKADLVRNGAWREGRYTTAKAGFVVEIVNQARAARGLPPVTRPL